VSAVAAKPETTPAVESKPAPITASKPTEFPAREQLALLTNKPVEVTPPKPALTRPAVKSLEGFIIQLAFSDREKAQRWAESMEKRGYAVSLTEAGAEGSLRVRLGNFSVRDDAERQLRTFKQEGMNGIIINLPQAYRPEARTSIP
jgi:cell division septation protein DedD